MPDLLATEMVDQRGDSLHNSRANTQEEPRAPSLKRGAAFSWDFQWKEDLLLDQLVIPRGNGSPHMLRAS